MWCSRVTFSCPSNFCASQQLPLNKAALFLYRKLNIFTIFEILFYFHTFVQTQLQSFEAKSSVLFRTIKKHGYNNITNRPVLVFVTMCFPRSFFMECLNPRFSFLSSSSMSRWKCVGRGDVEVIIHATGSHNSMITSPNAL